MCYNTKGDRIMSFFKQKSNIIFLSVIFLLTVALAAVSCFAIYRDNKRKAVITSLSQNNVDITDKDKQISDLKAQIEAAASLAEQEKADLNAQLQSALVEKQRLEQENAVLNSQLQNLSEVKRREELQQQIALRNINQADTVEGGICYLTFDDGPSVNTLKILDILDAYGIKATFFVIGTGNTNYMSQIVNRGHAIGLHSTTHDYSQIYSSVNNYLTDIQQISDIVFNATGVRSNIIRFPGGSSNVVSQKYCRGIMSDLTVRMPQLGYSYFDWNVVSGDADAKSVPASTIINRVLTAAQGKNSICVLMHDSSVKKTTVEALPSIIEGLDAMGYRFAPIVAETYGFHQAVSN